MKSELHGLWLPSFDKNSKATPILKATELNYLTLLSIFFTDICFQYQKGRQNHIRLSYAYVNVHFVYVNSLIFDVIDGFNTAEKQ